MCRCCHRHRLKTLNLTGYLKIILAINCKLYAAPNLCIILMPALLRAQHECPVRNAVILILDSIIGTRGMTQSMHDSIRKKMVLFWRRKPGVKAKLLLGPTNFQNTLEQGNLVRASCGRRSPIFVQVDAPVHWRCLLTCTRHQLCRAQMIVLPTFLLGLIGPQQKMWSWGIKPHVLTCVHFAPDNLWRKILSWC